MINVIAIAGTNPFSDFLLDHIFGGFLKSLEYHVEPLFDARPQFGSSSMSRQNGTKKPNFLDSPQNGHDHNNNNNNNNHNHNHNHNHNYHNHYNHLPSPNETTTLLGTRTFNSWQALTYGQLNAMCRCRWTFVVYPRDPNIIQSYLLRFGVLGLCLARSNYLLIRCLDGFGAFFVCD